MDTDAFIYVVGVIFFLFKFSLNVQVGKSNFIVQNRTGLEFKSAEKLQSLYLCKQFSNLSVTFCVYLTNEALTLLPCGRPEVIYFAKISEAEALHN